MNQDRLFNFDEASSGGKHPAGESMDSLLRAERAGTFELVLHFVRCDTMTVSPNQIIIINYCYKIYIILFIIIISENSQSSDPSMDSAPSSVASDGATCRPDEASISSSEAGWYVVSCFLIWKSLNNANYYFTSIPANIGRKPVSLAHGGQQRLHVGFAGNTCTPANEAADKEREVRK